MIKKIVNIYVQAIDNAAVIPVDCRSSIEIIGKTLLNSLLEVMGMYEVNLIGSISNNNIIISFENIIVINTFDLTDFEFISKFKNKIYFFDDLSVWKIENNEYYRKNLIFEHYLIPIESNAIDLAKQLQNVYYVPYSSSDIFDAKQNPIKSMSPSIFVDIMSKNRYADSDKGVISTQKAIRFCNCLLLYDIDVYVHEIFKEDIFGSNIKYISDMPRAQFYDFIKNIWFYGTSVMGSYEFIILESTINGGICIDIDNSVNREHLKSKATISSDWFLENYLEIILNFDGAKNYFNAKSVYNSALYENILINIIK